VVHNEYLRLIAETGLVGGALFLLAMVQWWRAALGVMRVERARRPVEPAGGAWPAPPSSGIHGLRDRSAEGRCAREFAAAALALLAAWAVIAMTDNAFDYYAPLTQYAAFFSAAALVGGLGVGAHPAGTPPGPGGVRKKRSDAHAR
jgi:O-antigen ligase